MAIGGKKIIDFVEKTASFIGDSDFFVFQRPGATHKIKMGEIKKKVLNLSPSPADGAVLTFNTSTGNPEWLTTAGAFIPLAGTEPNKPVTGEVLFQRNDGATPDTESGSIKFLVADASNSSNLHTGILIELPNDQDEWAMKTLQGDGVRLSAFRPSFGEKIDQNTRGFGLHIRTNSGLTPSNIERGFGIGDDFFTGDFNSLGAASGGGSEFLGNGFFVSKTGDQREDVFIQYGRLAFEAGAQNHYYQAAYSGEEGIFSHQIIRSGGFGNRTNNPQQVTFDYGSPGNGFFKWVLQPERDNTGVPFADWFSKGTVNFANSLNPLFEVAMKTGPQTVNNHDLIFRVDTAGEDSIGSLFVENPLLSEKYGLYVEVGAGAYFESRKEDALEAVGMNSVEVDVINKIIVPQVESVTDKGFILEHDKSPSHANPNDLTGFKGLIESAYDAGNLTGTLRLKTNKYRFSELSSTTAEIILDSTDTEGSISLSASVIEAQNPIRYDADYSSTFNNNPFTNRHIPDVAWVRNAIFDVENAGSLLPKRDNLNFKGALEAVDNAPDTDLDVKVNGVDFSRMQDIDQDRVFGRTSSGTGDPEQVTMIQEWVAVPTSSSDTGITGQKAQDGTYVYLCYNTDSWLRISINSTSF